MYNRYLRNDDGVYTRMPMQDAPRGEPPRYNCVKCFDGRFAVRLVKPRLFCIPFLIILVRWML